MELNLIRVLEKGKERKNFELLEQIINNFQTAPIVVNNNLKEYVNQNKEIIKDIEIEESVYRVLEKERNKINQKKLTLKENISRIKKLKVNQLETFSRDASLGNFNLELEKLNSDYETLDKQMKISEYKLKVLSNQEKAPKRYPEINLAFLNSKSTWKVKYKDKSVEVEVPRFAVFDYFSDNSFNINIYITYGERKFRGVDADLTSSGLTGIPLFKNNLPNSNLNPYEYSKVQRIDLETNFPGFIPMRVKREIKDAEKYFGKHIYAIAEVKNWAVKINKDKDPLFIGIIKNKAFLIDSCNVTPIERYVLDTNVHGKPGQN